MALRGDVKVIICADNDADEKYVPQGILSALGPETVLMSNDSLRMYVRKTQWEKMKDSFKLTSK
jgi:hypothetical protein